MAMLIDDLGLTSCQDTLVGSIEKKYISGGERKRTAIGVELITDPQIILCDEPTSGLDSMNATNIAKILQRLARRRNKTIVSTIHQPNSEAFSYCDRLILLADGHIVYQGKAKNSFEYFEMGRRSVNRMINPCDHFMKELSVNYPKEPEDEAKLAHYIQKYADEQAPEIEEDMDTLLLGNLDVV